jgi:hypothetical protein
MVAILLVAAGLSESVGRILPVIARGRWHSRQALVWLIAAGTIVDALFFAVWPVLAGFVLQGLSGHPPSGPAWTAGSVAVLLLAAVLAMPVVGPFLHLAVFVVAGSLLSTRLAPAVGFWPCSLAVALAGFAVAFAVGCVRTLVGGPRAREVALP